MNATTGDSDRPVDAAGLAAVVLDLVKDGRTAHLRLTHIERFFGVLHTLIESEADLPSRRELTERVQALEAQFAEMKKATGR